MILSFGVSLLSAGASRAEPDGTPGRSGATGIGSRRELMVDKHLIAKMGGGAELRLHRPMPRNVALETDRPWEGNVGGLVTAFRDGDKCRMYYKAFHAEFDQGSRRRPHPWYVCYAESEDGIRWRRPELGLFEHNGSKDNNIVWRGAGPKQSGIHGFAPFKDGNPDAAPAHRYKAVGANRRARFGGLWALSSPDGVHWSILGEEPILPQKNNARFDSQNVAFWNPHTQRYRVYFREKRNGHRGIRTAVSRDFRDWSEPEWVKFPGAANHELYTNQVLPYPRAPHIFVGFPTRYIERPWSHAIENLPQLDHRKLRASVKRPLGTALTDGLFMSSRDGRTFKRWGEAFIRPGPQQEGNWAYGDNYQSWGLIRTEAQRKGVPDRLSFFATEGYWRGDSTTFRRYTIRMDGFVSVNAPLDGGSFVTKPITFAGDQLRLNFATSAAGRLRVELQSAGGEPLDGYTLSDCDPVIGDELDRAVTWDGSADVSALAGEPVRMKVTLHDADLYAFRFTSAE